MNRLRFLPIPCLLTLAAGCAGSQIEEQKKAVESLQAQARQRFDETRGLSDKISSLESERTSLQGQLSDLTAKLDSSQSRAEMLTKSNKDLSTAMESNKGQITTKLKELVQEKDELSRKLTELKKAAIKSNRILKSQAEAANAENEQLKAELEASRKELDSIGANRQQVSEQLKDRMAKTRAEQENLSESLRPELASQQASLAQAGEAIRLTLQVPLLFKAQDAKLTDAGASFLDRLAKALNALPHRSARVEGHSDNSTINWSLFGGYTSHWDLSSARATAVARHLHNKGVNPRRLTAAGYGEFRPVAPNDTAEGQAANRRIVLLLEPMQASASAETPNTETIPSP